MVFFFVCIIWNYYATLSVLCHLEKDPDELEVYGTDTTTGPLLTSYKFEVWSCSVCMSWLDTTLCFVWAISLDRHHNYCENWREEQWTL